MKKLFFTIYVYIRNTLLRHIIPSIALAIIFNTVLMLVRYKKEKGTDSLKVYAKGYITKGLIGRIIAESYFIMPMWAAVIVRLFMPRQEPLSDIFGGWWLFVFEYTYSFDFLVNIIMFVPMAAMMCLYRRSNGTKTLDLTKIGTFSVLASIAYSGVIEALQIILRVGTFQISDLVYNLVGAIAGAIITVLIINKIKQ